MIDFNSGIDGRGLSVVGQESRLHYRESSRGFGLYYKFEDGGQPWTEVHNHNSLLDTFGTIPSVSTAGKIGDGVLLKSRFAASGALGLGLLASNNTVSGWTYFGWFKMLRLPDDGTYNAVPLVAQIFPNSGAVGTGYAEMRLVSGVNPWCLQINRPFLPSEELPLTPPIVDEWNFFAVWWDDSDKKFRVRINDGAISVSSLAWSNKSFSASLAMAAGGSGTPGLTVYDTIILDEYGVWSRPLSLAELDIAYNGGSGRTWQNIEDLIPL